MRRSKKLFGLGIIGILLLGLLVGCGDYGKFSLSSSETNEKISEGHNEGVESGESHDEEDRN